MFHHQIILDIRSIDVFILLILENEFVIIHIDEQIQKIRQIMQKRTKTKDKTDKTDK
jgi:hypothetical protein